MSASTFMYREGLHTYFNVTIPHNDDNNPYSLPTQAKYFDERTQDIIDRPQDYYISLIRFDVPISEIPIFTAGAIPFDTTSGLFPAGANNNVNKLGDSITLSYGGVDTQVFLEWLPEINTPAPTNTPSQANPQQNANLINNPYYYVKSYQHYLDLINMALAAAYYGTAFAGSPPKVASAKAPYMIYDSATQLMSLIADKSFDPITAGAPTIQIYMNTLLYELFNDSFNVYQNGYTAANGKNIQILVENTGNNLIQSSVTTPSIPAPPAWSATINYQLGDIVSSGGNTYISIATNNLNHLPPSAQWTAYVVPTPTTISGSTLLEMKQEYQTLDLWNSFQTIVFTTASIPIVNEFVRNDNGSGDAVTIPILTDFSNADTTSRKKLSYFPQGPYRMTSLKGITPLRKTDIQVYWTNEYQQLFPLMIPSHENVTMKFMFRRKDYTGS
jgi:hypothetical protein